MIIKDLDLKPKINAVMRDFMEQVFESSPCFVERFTLTLLEHQDFIPKLSSSPRWEKLGKETSGEIIPT